MTVKGVLYSPGHDSDPARVKAAEAFKAAFKASISDIADDSGVPDPLSDCFIAVLRRLNSHNSYNPII